MWRASPFPGWVGLARTLVQSGSWRLVQTRMRWDGRISQSAPFTIGNPIITARLGGQNSARSCLRRSNDRRLADALRLSVPRPRRSDSPGRRISKNQIASDLPAAEVLHHAVFGRHRQWLLRRPITSNQRKQVQRNRPLCDCHHVNKVSNELFFALGPTHARVPITGERRSSCALLCLSGWLSPRSLCPAALTIQAPGARTIAMEATTAASSPLGNARFRYRGSEASARDASDDVMLSASGRDVADAIARTFNAPQPGTVYDHRLDPIHCNGAVHRLNIYVEPTEMPCTLARRANISPGLSSVAGDLC
jgi:hypothetical protein